MSAWTPTTPSTSSRPACASASSPRRGRRAADAAAVRALVAREAAVLDEGARAALADRVAELAFGLGPLEPLLRDPEVDEVLVNGVGPVWVERRGRLEPGGPGFASEAELRHAIERILAPLGRRADEAEPLCDARLPDGSRVNVVLPPLAVDGPVLTIRRFRRRALTAADLVANGTWPAGLADVLGAAVRARLSILVAGGTGSGKTTTLNVLSSFVPPDERLVTIEDTAELRLVQPHVVRLEARPPSVEGRGEVTIRRLVRNALRMRPDRIVVGEVRGGEALDMLQAMATGHDGSLGTIHAGSPEEAIRRLETLALMAGVGLPHRAIRDQVADALDLVVAPGASRRRRASRAGRGGGRPGGRWPGHPRALRRAGLSARAGGRRRRGAWPKRWASGGRDRAPRMTGAMLLAAVAAALGVLAAWDAVVALGDPALGPRLARVLAPLRLAGAGGGRVRAGATPARARRGGDAARRGLARRRPVRRPGPRRGGAVGRPPRAGREGGPVAPGARGDRPARRPRAGGRAGRGPCARAVGSTRPPATAGCPSPAGPSCGRRPPPSRRARPRRTSSSACVAGPTTRAGTPSSPRALLQRDTGGDLARLLRDVATALEDGARARLDARGATAQARATATIVTAMPVGAAVLAELAAPGSLAALAGRPATAALALGAVALQVTGLLVVRRLARTGPAA